MCVSARSIISAFVSLEGTGMLGLQPKKAHSEPAEQN